MIAPLPIGYLPLQLTGLSRLHSLELGHMFFARSDNTVLTTLSSLRRLALSSVADLPACLSQLVELEALSIEDPLSVEEDGHGDAAVLVQAVGTLTRLTHLALAHYDAPGLEAALPSLPALRSLRWLPNDPSVFVVLPAGSWLTNLQCLALPIHLLVNSLAALESAPQLHTLAADSIASGSAAMLPWVLRWAAQRPSLADLVVRVSDKDLGSQFNAVMEVQESGPSLLHLRRHTCLVEHPLFSAVA